MSNELDSNTQAQRGVRDWTEKRAILRNLANVASDTDFVRYVFMSCGSFDSSDTFEINRCRDVYGKWSASTPTDERYRRFWEWISDEWFGSMPSEQLYNCDASAFAMLLADEDFNSIARGLGSVVPNMSSELARRVRGCGGIAREVPVVAYGSGNHYQITYYRDTKIEGPDQLAKLGRLKSGQFYTTPAAAEAWRKLVDARNYRMYLDCSVSLEQLVESTFWNNVVSGGRYNAAVALAGGGSPDKDFVVARELARRKHGAAPIDYVIVDISSYMIRTTAAMLGPQLRREGLDADVNVRQSCDDVLFLDQPDRFPRSERWDGVVWTLLGGTIGNFKEQEFFRSVNAPAAVGDLLIVGIDTYDRKSIDTLKKDMVEQYRCEELDDLLLTPFCTGTDRCTTDVRVAVGLSNQKDEQNYTDVQNSKTVLMTVDLGEEQAVLAWSTRYLFDEFITFAASWGWELLGSSWASESSGFRQLLLRRTA